MVKTWFRYSYHLLNSEKSGGIILLCCTVISLLLANSFLSQSYQHVWLVPFFSQPIEFWVNDGLMTIFFLQVGLEIKREIYVGELNNIKKSLLPVLAALGGMLMPALIHFVLNNGTPAQKGFGIPTATDIAFSLGILSLLGNRVPASLKIFLTALAIIDDLGAVLVIAIFYSTHFSLLYLGLAFFVFTVLILLNRWNVLSIWIYLLLGCALWFCMHRSGVHATISGVLLAFAIPFRDGSEESLSTILQHALHKPVTLIILPLFALANTAIVIPTSFTQDLFSMNSLGIMLGLVIGKPLGIFLFSWISVMLGWNLLPADLKLKHIFSIGILAGIGFTMSIFISILAFNDSYLIDSSKIAVLLGSTGSGIIGLITVRWSVNKK